MLELPNRSSVGVTIPATPAYLRHIRVLAATIADDLAFDVEAIESLRVAVDELCALAMADATDDAVLSVVFEATADALVLQGRCAPVTEDPALDPIAEQLLRAGSEHHELRRDGDACLLELRARRASVGAGSDGR